MNAIRIMEASADAQAMEELKQFIRGLISGVIRERVVLPAIEGIKDQEIGGVAMDKVGL